MMRTTILLSLLCLGAFSNASGATALPADSLMRAAEKAYSDGDHQQALDLYKSLNIEFSSASLLYNIGNCNFKLGDYPQAILYYERALRMDPGSEEVHVNLELARQQVVDRMKPMPTFELGAFWARLRSGGGVDSWARRSLVAGLLLFTALSLLLFPALQRLRSALRVVAAIAGVVLLTSAGFAYARHAALVDCSESIIMRARIEVLSEPRAGSTVIFVLHKGTKLSILQQRDGWSEVRLPNGSVGWTQGEALEVI